MAKPVVTEALVFTVADQLQAGGTEPTIIMVQERIGGGSYTTVKRYLDAWKQHQTRQPVVEVPAEVTVQGMAAMVMHGPWHIGNLSKLPFTGYAQAPQIGDAFAVWGNSHQLAVATDDPAKQAAAGCWIGWLSQNSAQWATAGQVPAREDARMTLPEAAAPVRAFASEIEAVIMPPNIAGFSSAVGGAEGFGRAVDPVLLGDQSDVQAALDQAAQRSTELLQQNAQTYGQ